jgi:hypothetical protein
VGKFMACVLNLTAFRICKALKESGFVYEKKGSKVIVVERGDVCLGVVRTSSKLRRSGKKIRAFCESIQDTPYKATVDTRQFKNLRQAFVAGLSLGLESPAEHGPRFSLPHARNEKRFEPDS